MKRWLSIKDVCEQCGIERTTFYRRQNSPNWPTLVPLKSGLNDRILIGFNVGDGWIESGSRHMSYPPTHWMPLPTPPLTKGGEGDG